MRHFAIAAGFAFVITAMLAVGPARADHPIMSDGKCWLNTNATNYHWGECPAEKKGGHHHKG